MTANTLPPLKTMSPCLLVNDIDHAIAFYTEQLDFTLQFRYNDYYAGIIKDGFTIHLKTGDPSPEERRRKADNSDVDIVFSVDKIEELYLELGKKPIEITQPLCERTYGTDFYIADPDGYVLAFVEAR